MTVGATGKGSSAKAPAGLAAWSVAALAVALGGPLILSQQGAVLPAGLALLMVLAVVYRGVHAQYPHDRFGLCNGVTLMRAALTAGLFGALWSGMQGWPVLITASVALALDGVDGWLARRSGLVSGFGARFDMETDAALALVLAAHVWLAGMTGPEVLVLGLARYVFVAAFWPCPWLAAPLPDRFGRKVVCVIQIAALIVLQTPGLTAPIAGGIAWGAMAALLWSFGRDVLWLWRHR